MREEATIEEWRLLYEVAIKLKELKPWEHLWDMDLITIKEKNLERRTTCSVMGAGGECYAIAAYRGEDQLKGLFEFAYGDAPSHQGIKYQNNIMCYFGDREELSTKERNIIKELGLKFRGKNNWIYFRTFETGYVPFMPNRDEVIQFTSILRNLYMAIIALHKGLIVDFENGKTLTRFFDEKSNMWLNLETDFQMPSMSYNAVTVTDEILINNLRKKKQNKTVLEIDLAVLSSSFNDKDFDKPLIPMVCLLVDSTEGLILSQQMITPNDSKIEAILYTIINYIDQLGRPKEIRIRDGFTGSILMDLCEKLNIKLKDSPKLRIIDDVVESFGSRF